MLFAILFITFVSFQPEVFGSYTNPLMHYQEPSDSDEDMRLYLAHRRGDRPEERSDSDCGDDEFAPFSPCNSPRDAGSVSVSVSVVGDDPFKYDNARTWQDDGEDTLEAVNIPWNVSKHIEKLAKEYVDYCKQQTLIKINRNNGLGLLLGFSKSHRHKNKITTRTLAWIAIKKDEIATHYDELVTERADYMMHIDIYDEVETLKLENPYMTEAVSDLIWQKEIAFSEWRSRVTEPNIATIRAYATNLAPTIAAQGDFLRQLTSLHDKNLITSKEGAIAFVFKNAGSEHQQFFTDHQSAIEKYITETYYPDVE